MVTSSRKKAGFDLQASARCSIVLRVAGSSLGLRRHISLHLAFHFALVRGIQTVSYPAERASVVARRTGVSSPRSSRRES